MSISSRASSSSDGVVIHQINSLQAIAPKKIPTYIVSVALKPITALQALIKEFSCFEKIPMPGQMAFNNTQTAYFDEHTPPRVSKKINKLVGLKKIAYAQEKAGVCFDGRRSAAEAEVELLQELLVQSSQSARIQNPFTFVADSIKYLKDGISYYFQSTPSINNLVDEFSQPIGSIKFNVRKSATLCEFEAEGKIISTIGIGLVDSGHTSVGLQNGIKLFLEKHFNSERGDIFLTEAAIFFEEIDGKDIVSLPTLEKHHNYFCMGLPLQSCQFFREPEKEVAFMLSVMSERRALVQKIFEFLMSAIPPEKAREARQRLEIRNSQTTSVDTEFRVKLIIDYQDYCDPAKQARFSRRVDPLTEIVEKEKKAQLDTAAVRDPMYFQQLSQASKQLKPGARLFYTMGAGHFGRLEKKINFTDTFIVDIDISNIKDEL